MQKLESAFTKLVKVISIVFAFYTLLLPTFPINALAARTGHLAFVFTILILKDFILKDEKKNAVKTAIWLILLVASVVSCIYVFTEAQELLLWRLGMNNKQDIIAGFIILAMVLICTKKCFGWLITCIILFFMAYMMFGQYLPASVGHPGVSFTRMIGNIALGNEGIYGAPLGAATSTVAIFVIFASFLELSGGFQVFMDLSMALCGQITGGAAKVAVVSSSLFGSISGSAAANTAATGMITIPAMKKSGYENHVAGAVEAAASSGGQLMPPVMGAAAFVMAEMLGLPYSDIMVAGIVPAICYYIAIFMSVDLYSRKHGIGGAGEEFMLTPEKRRETFRRAFLISPLAVLFFLVGALSWSAAKAALWCTVLVILVAYPYKDQRFGIKKILEGLAEGAQAVLNISVICAASGIIIGVFTVTGLGLKLSSIIVQMAMGQLILLLILAMIASLILGMGVPTVAAYLILAILVAPALVEFGVLPIAAHMFVFYFGIISAITPPVALAAYVGAGIAEAPPVKVGFTACKLALPAFVVPYILVYNPALVMQSDSVLAIVQVVASTMLGCFLCSITVQRYLFKPLNMVQTVLTGLATVCVLIPESITDYIGIAIAVVALAPVYISAKKEKAAAKAAE